MQAACSIERRAPQTVMRLSRLGSLHQSRLSFMRVLTRGLARNEWQFSQTAFNINQNGVGHAVYTAHGPQRNYSLVAFAHELPDSLRSDRVIAEAWDATFCLFDGIPTAADITRLEKNVPYQEAGRVSESELTLSRANRSVRLWNHVVDALAKGEQPDAQELKRVGYLMRTTAVYGSGKFGAADREMIAEREEMQVPFQSEMLSVYLIRTFVRDLVEHMACCRGGDAACSLDPRLARQLGIGNSTGLGMAPFLINHPVLINNWMMVREEAIARVRMQVQASDTAVTLFCRLFEASTQSINLWRSDHPYQQRKLEQLKADLTQIEDHIATCTWAHDYPWDRLISWSATVLSEEGQEMLTSLILEPYAELIDGLVACMSDSNGAAFHIDGSMTVMGVQELIEQSFGWALDIDWGDQHHCARAWYVSEEKLEPRLGERHVEPIAEYEQPLAPARDAAAAYSALLDFRKTDLIAEFLLHHPEHRHTVRRAQMSTLAPYGEIRDNTIAADMLPIDLLRAKLSFFGATHFDPRSDRWVRIKMFSGAPYPEELNVDNADFWIYPGCQ